MKPLVEESLLKFEGDDNQLFWEFRYLKSEDPDAVSHYLNIQIPVAGTGIVHQSFPLDQTMDPFNTLSTSLCDGGSRVGYICSQVVFPVGYTCFRSPPSRRCCSYH